MTPTRSSVSLAAATVLLVLFSAGNAPAEPLSIYEVQYVDLTADPTGTSPYHETIVDCVGGIVVKIWVGSRPRLIVQDPDYPDGWGAIQVKGWSGGDSFEGINVGDHVSFTEVYVEDYRGTTFLQFGGSNGPAPDAEFTVNSTDNPIPDPKIVTLDQIAAPLEGPPGEWYVADHSAEPFESMQLTVENVTVTALGLGKEGDNYNLQNADGDAWASDYMNDDLIYGYDYHAYVDIGAQFYSVTGILEQYQKDDSPWDYYQLLTTCTEDFHPVPEPAACAMLLTTITCLAGWTLLRRRRP